METKPSHQRGEDTIKPRIGKGRGYFGKRKSRKKKRVEGNRAAMLLELGTREEGGGDPLAGVNKENIPSAGPLP